MSTKVGVSGCSCSSGSMYHSSLIFSHFLLFFSVSTCFIELTVKAYLYVIFWDKTHTHTHLTALFPGLPGWAGTRKVKPIWILLKQETVSGIGIRWAICKSASRSRQITMPVPHHSSFFTGRMPFLPPNQQRQSTKGTEIKHLNLIVVLSYNNFPVANYSCSVMRVAGKWSNFDMTAVYQC